MHRRHFVQAALAFVAALFGRLFPRWARRLPAPDGSPMVVRWSGRIVPLPWLLNGQRERCCEAEGPDLRDCSRVVHAPGEHVWGRTPVHGSPERAYLEYMAKNHPQPEEKHSDSSTLRRLDRGELAVDDVYIHLVSAEEIDTDEHGFYAGGRREAYADYISVLA